MAKLILSLDGQVIKEHDVSKERMTIGRKPHNDIQIDNLAVSGEHAMIMTILNDSFLEDLGSTNGTMVNGQPVKKHFLQSEDVVEIGKYKLKYVNDQAGNMTQQEFEKTMILRAPAEENAPPKAASGTDDHSDAKMNSTQTDLGTSTVPGASSGAAAPDQQKAGAAPAQTATNPGELRRRNLPNRSKPPERLHKPEPKVQSRFFPDRMLAESCRSARRSLRWANRAFKSPLSQNVRRDFSSRMSRALISRR